MVPLRLYIGNSVHRQTHTIYTDYVKHILTYKARKDNYFIWQERKTGCLSQKC